MKYLTVNADEFGLTDKINEAILRAHKEGIVTSTTLMVNTKAFKYAARIAEFNPSLEVGLHLNLTFGKPISRAASLIDEKGLFFNRKQFLLRLFLNKVNSEDIEDELNAQIDKFTSSGLELFHIDSHQHIHLHPKLMGIFIKIAKKNNVVIRCPKDRILYQPTNLIDFVRIIFKGHFIKRIVIIYFCKRLKSLAKKEGVIITDNFISPHSVYRGGQEVSGKTFLTILDSIKDGYTELMCHPGKVDAELMGISRYTLQREDELNAIISRDLKKKIDKKQIKLIGFKKILEDKKKINVLHVITRSIEGGAPENTFLTIQGVDSKKFTSHLACGGNGPLIKRTLEAGFNCYIIPGLAKEINPILDFIAFINLWRLMKKVDFDIVHTHASKAGILARIAARLAGIPIIIHTIHGFGFNDYQHALTKSLFVWIERLCAKFTDKIIAVSSLNIEKAKKFGIGRNGQFVAIHSGIVIEKYSKADIDIQKKRQELGISHKSKIIGMVGHVDKGKGHEFLLDAVPQVITEVPDTKFVIIGDGKLSSKIKQKISKNNLNTSVFMLGTRDDVTELYPIMDIFVLPTLWEGLPRVIPEAMAMGLPIVTTPVDGIPEAITDRINGLFVPPRDPKSLAEALIYLLKNPERARELGREAKKRVDPDFSADKMVDDIQKIYKNLVQEKLGASA